MIQHAVGQVLSVNRSDDGRVIGYNVRVPGSTQGHRLRAVDDCGEFGRGDYCELVITQSSNLSSYNGEHRAQMRLAIQMIAPIGYHSDVAAEAMSDSTGVDVELCRRLASVDPAKLAAFMRGLDNGQPA